MSYGLLLEALASGVRSKDEEEGRIYGLLYGVVTNIADPKGLGRVRARVGAQRDGDSTDWLDPSWQGAIESVPRVGDPIFVMFVDGDPHRGVYSWHPTTRTLNRATEPLVLGISAWGIINFLVTQFNQLRTDMYNHIHSVTGITLGTSNIVTGPVATSAVPAVQGQNADGSTIPVITTSRPVVSGEAFVRGGIGGAGVGVGSAGGGGGGGH